MRPFLAVPALACVLALPLTSQAPERSKAEAMVKEGIEEALAVAQKKGGGWADYKRMNPETRKIEDKTSFCLAEAGIVVGCGIYKQRV